MMKKLIITLTFFGLTLLQNAYAQNSPSQFSKIQILEDLQFLRTSLEQTHYNLYANTPKAEFIENFDKVKNSITSDSVSLFESINLFQKVVSKSNTGHCEIDFPALAYREYAYNNGTVFPFELAFEQNKAFVRKNYSQQHKVLIGSEVLSIDGEPMKQILKKIYPQLSAERIYFKNAKLELYSFPRLYWQVFGQKTNYKVKLKNNSKTHEIIVSSVNLIEEYEKKRNEVASSIREFKLIDNIAYINPGPFSASVNSTESDFQEFVKTSFATIKKQKSETLIIDLRNNTGGHNSYSDYLISYIANKPFKWHSKFTLKSSEILKQSIRKNNDLNDDYFRSILQHKNGETYDYNFDSYDPIALNKRFNKKVYVLINRHSYSMAAAAAAVVQDYKFATIVGEETGDTPTLYASQFSFNLPHTNILVKVPKGYIIRPNGNEKLKGVMPDIEIRDHLIDEQDEILDGLLKIINS